MTGYPKQATSHPIVLPQFPALTSLTIRIFESTPSPHLIDTLSSFSSVPVLASISLSSWWRFPFELDPSVTWDHLDRWLAQIAGNATVEGGLVLMLEGWREDRVPEDFLPRFREAGKINTDFVEFDTRR